MSLPPNLRPGIKFRINTSAGCVEHQLPGTLEGRPYYWALHPVTKEQAAKGSARQPNGLPGQYKVVITLAKPGYARQTPGSHSAGTEAEGDSNLYIGSEFASKNVLLLKSDNRDFEVHFEANSRGRLGKLVLNSIHATGFVDARQLAWAAVSPTLSLLSADLDIPLHISQVDVVELSSQAVAGSIVTDYVDVGLFIAGLHGMSEEFRHYASMYREALISNSASYEFLCLFKIIESIMSRRARLAREAREKGETLQRNPERFPQELDLVNWLDSLLPPTARRNWARTNIVGTFPAEILGKKFRRIVEDYLRPLRVRIAHGLLDNGELGTSIDDFEQLAEIDRWLPATKYVVRQLLKTEFPDEYLLGVGDSHAPATELETLSARVSEIWPGKFST